MDANRLMIAAQLEDTRLRFLRLLASPEASHVHMPRQPLERTLVTMAIEHVIKLVVFSLQLPALGITRATTVDAKRWVEQLRIIHATDIWHVPKLHQRLATTPVTAKSAVNALETITILSFRRTVVTLLP